MSSYVSIEVAQEYFDTRMIHESWTDATETDKLRAVITATRLIDRLNFAGAKAVTTQSLEFPRDSDTEIPESIEIACCELAYQLLDGRDPEFEYESYMGQSGSLGPVSVSSDPNIIPEHIAHGIVSTLAWSYLKPFMRDPLALVMERTR
jgi:hypothetical protein